MAVPPPRSRLVWISTAHRPEPAWRQDEVESCEEDLKSDGDDEPRRGMPEV